MDETARRQAQAILGALGKEIYVDDEGYLDMATALSGTGPAYVFLFMEALIDAGVHMGFSRRVAQELVVQTIEGSVAMARETGLHPTELRNRVTSPGGTSAAALVSTGEGRPAHRDLEGRLGGLPAIRKHWGRWQTSEPTSAPSLTRIFTILYILILVDVIGSWIVAARLRLPNFVFDILQAVHSIAAPILNPIRRLMPNMGGLDLSPIIALFLLQILQSLFRQAGL